MLDSDTLKPIAFLCAKALQESVLKLNSSDTVDLTDAVLSVTGFILQFSLREHIGQLDSTLFFICNGVACLLA